MAFNVSEIAKAVEWTLHQLDEAAHNLANVSTPGFKAEHLYNVTNATNSQKKDSLNQMLQTPVYHFYGTKEIDLSQGILEKTGNNLDAAIEGEGFFTIQQGSRTSYTRNGGFVINKNHELVTKTGAQVLGESGPISINGTSVIIDSEGSIVVDGNSTGKLKIATFNNPALLTRTGEGQYIDEGNAGLKKAENYRVAGGYVEASNVNAIKEMVDMIVLQRNGAETYQKLIQTLSDFDKISTSRIGKLI
jgi:flagellar basal-body rod protein FlgF